jgi:hypothetical protein
MPEIYRITEDDGHQYTLCKLNADGTLSNKTITTPYGTIYDSIQFSTHGDIQPVVASAIVEDEDVVPVGKGYILKSQIKNNRRLFSMIKNLAA